MRDGEDVRVACVGADERSRAGGLSGDEVVFVHVVECFGEVALEVSHCAALQRLAEPKR